MLKMHGLHHNSLFLLAAVAVIALSSAFNIDFINPDVYRGEQEDFFGYEVLQTSSARTKGIIVTAPLRLNGSGGICQYDKDKTQKWFQPNETFQKNTTVVKHLGLSIAAKPTGSQFTVCSPSLAHECNDNTYLNSLCYDLSDELKQLSSYQPQFQSCTKKTVNLVFLFDGSLSMTEDEFSKNKDFIKDIMASLKNTSIKFAAVQFSADYRTVFTFSDYEAGRALNKLKGEQHMKSLTNTYRALKFVLKELFENPSAGASLDAIKVLVLITDGDPSDGDSSNIIEQYERKKIIRFVIGVKVKSMDKFKPIASEPKEKNIFKIEEYNGLEGILGNFQNRIFSVEGSTRGWAGKLINEMSQSGFSAVFNKDILVLGSVGSNNWRGSLQEKLGQQEDQILDLNMQMDSYMGFSVSVGERRGVSLYFTGAPRFEHKGQVVLFSNKTKMWEVVQRINESQIGSYFGAELCSVDVNSDGDTDFLLVGAPMFFQPQEMKEGKVYVYMLTDELQLKSELNVTAPSMGRFGTTISSLADLNGDGLRDIAIGAPMEDDNRGAVYIYLGDNYRGIRSTFSQRISGEKFDSGIRFFGQAIDGHMDLGDDGLPDIVVGSKGAALVLRSRPVFNVRAHMSFHPEVISTENIDCVFNKGENLHMVNLTVCFEKEEATKSKGGAAESGLSIMCTLSIDPMRQSHRGFFSQTDRTVRSFTSNYDLIDKETCFDYSISMAKCVIDTLSPINIKLNFSQIGSEDANTTLNVDSKRQALVEIPFEKQCRKNDTCIAELEVDFNFISSTLLVTENNYFNVSIKLDNHGDDSYNTSLTIHYPPGLSFSRMILSKATFTSSFHIMHKNEWNDTMLMTVTAKSDNSNSSKTASLTKSIPVQFEVRMASTVNKESVTYLNFTSEDTDPKNIITVYRIDNTGFKEFPVNVSLVFPTELEHHFELNNFRVLVKENETQCSTQSYWKSELCSQKSCIRMECDTFYLKKYSHVEFTLEGNAQFKDFKEYAKNIGFLKRYSGENGEVRFWSFIQVDFDKQKYVLASHKPQKEDLKQEKNQKTDLPKENDQTKKKSEVRVEYIIPPDQWLIILTGAGLGLLLLIIITVIMFKLGCFKRKALPPLEEEKGDEPGEKASLQEATAESTQGPTKGMITKSETNCKSDESDESDLQKGLIIFNEDNDDLQPDDSSEYQNLA